MRLTTHNTMHRGDRTAGRPGFVIVAVLIVVVVLSLAAYQFTEYMGAEYRSAARATDAAQARAAAVSGIHYTAAMLADPDSFYGTLNGDPFSDGQFQPQMVRDGTGNNSPRQQAWFSLVAVAATAPGTYEQRFGAVTDEGGKININALIQLDPTGQTLYNALMTLPNMTAEVADAIVDWVDPDDEQRPSGAESSAYLGLSNPYRAKNGPLNSIDELLLVQGVTPQLLYGNDRNRNGLADDDPAGSQTLDRGWSEFLTVYGRELNLDVNGVLRDNVNDSEDMPGLYARLTARVGPDLADYIMAYKMFTVSTPASATVSANGGSLTITISGGTGGNNTQQGSAGDLAAAVQAAVGATTPPANKRRIKSLLDLRNTQVTLPKPQGADANTPTLVVPSPLNDPAQLSGLLAKLLDSTTATAAVEMTPRINVNTAPREVLMALVPLSGGTTSTTAPTSGTTTSGTTSGTTGTTTDSSGSTATAAPAAGALVEADIDAIINLRAGLDPADPATLTGAWLVAPGGLNPDAFKKIEKYVTGRTMAYRVQSIGYFGQGGPVARVEAVIDINRGAPRVVYFRDLTELDSPRGFEPPR